MIEGDRPIGEYFPQINNMYSIGKKLFRINFTTYYYDPTEAEVQTNNNFIYHPMDMWKPEQKYSQAISKSKEGYAVVKQAKQNGKLYWHVVKYVITKTYK